MFKVFNMNTRKRCEICSDLTTETLAKGVKYVQSQQQKHQKKVRNIFKVNNINTRTRCEISSDLTIETLEKCVRYVQS